MHAAASTLTKEQLREVVYVCPHCGSEHIDNGVYTVCIKSNEPLLWCWYQTVLLHATQSTYDAPRPPTSKMYANIFNRSMQERVCVPVASGVWFSSLEFWLVWTLMFYKTPMAVVVPCSTCLVCPTKTGWQSRDA